MYVRAQTTIASWWRAVAEERRERGDRGDVPGWVLVTVMTAGLVTVLWALAGKLLTETLEDAITGITGGG
jgi:hypothetical protein